MKNSTFGSEVPDVENCGDYSLDIFYLKLQDIKNFIEIVLRLEQIIVGDSQKRVEEPLAPKESQSANYSVNYGVYTGENSDSARCES